MKLIQVVFIISVAALLFLYVNDNRVYHIARTLPFNSQLPTERGYEFAGLAILVLFLWGWYRLRNNGRDDDD